jgi:hypothetical protein
MKIFKDEFSHTILHKRDVLKEMKMAKKAKAEKAGLIEDALSELKKSVY